MTNNTETFPEYLDRVGADFNSSGYEATADDYFRAASRINVAVQRMQGLADQVENTGMLRSTIVTYLQNVVADLTKPLAESEGNE